MTLLGTHMRRSSFHMPAVAAIKANGDDKLKQYKCKFSTTNRFGSNITLLLQTWTINV